MRRSWLIAALAVVVAAVVVAVLAMRLGDDDSADLEAWAGSVCTSVSDWRASILALADVGSGLTADSLRERVDEAQAATDELVSSLQELGAPDVDSGQELRQELESAVAELRSDYDALRADAQEAFTAGSPVDFLRALAELAPRFQELVTGAATFLERLESAPSVAADTRAELSAAFQEAEACQELRGGE